MKYLNEKVLPEDKMEVRSLKYKIPYYTIIDGMLYRIGFSLPYLKCLDEMEANYVLNEIHEGVCKNYVGISSWAHKAIQQRYK